MDVKTKRKREQTRDRMKKFRSLQKLTNKRKYIHIILKVVNLFYIHCNKINY